MFESLTCPNCGQTVSSSKTRDLDDSKSVTCNACKLKCLLGQWRFAAVQVAKISPTAPAIIKKPLPHPPPIQVAVDYSALVRSFDSNLKIALWIAGTGLLLAGLSPFFKWVNIGGGGMTGIAGDGRILLAITAVASVAFVVAVTTKQFMLPLMLAVQVWGMIVLFWMGGLFWKLSSIANQTEVKDNLFAAMLSTILISPGLGLYIGLIGGIFITGALGYVAATHFKAKDRLIKFVAIETLAFCFGIGTTIILGPSVLPNKNENTSSNLFGFRETESATEIIVEAKLNKTFMLGNLQITPIKFELVRLQVRPLFGELQLRDSKSVVLSFFAKNISEGEVFSPFTSMEVIDSFGNVCSDPTDRVSFSSSVAIDYNGILQDILPGETAKVMVAFDPKIETAKEYNCVLFTQTSNKNDYKRWQIKFAPSGTDNN